MRKQCQLLIVNIKVNGVEYVLTLTGRFVTVCTDIGDSQLPVYERYKNANGIRSLSIYKPGYEPD